MLSKQTFAYTVFVLQTQLLRRQTRGVLRVEKVAAIDIGSNAIRLVIGGLDDHKKVQVFRKMREPVRLGKDVFEKERLISIDSMTLALKAFEKFRKVLQDQDIKTCRTVATSAVREAANRQDFVDIIMRAHGIKVDVIDGIEEALLIQRAIQEELSLLDKKALLLDIGGGSVELTSMEDGKVQLVESLKLGTVRLLKLVEKEKLTDAQLDKFIADTLSPVIKRLLDQKKKRPFEVCVGTGGNIECLGVIRANYLNKTSTSKLYLEELERITKKLGQMSYKERIEKWHLRPDRADVIWPAALVTKRVMQMAEVETMAIPRVGLKDGILLGLLTRK